MLRKLTRFALSFSLLATLLVGVSVATIAPAQAVATCAAGGPCALGDTGPGGGKVFYVSQSPTTFSCGPTMNLTCSYLEAAPKTWSGGTSDPTAIWAAHDYNPTGQSTYEALSASSLGRGYQHSISILTLEASTVAAGIARSYRGGGKIDWYLPATAELNLLCQLARGVSQNVNNACTGGTSSADFNAGGYWATSGYDSTKAWTQNFANGTLSGQIKGSAFSVRPIRAFGAAPAKVDQATLTVNSESGTFGSTVTLTSSGGSGTGSVTFATTSTSCSISGTTLSVTAAVTCAVVATKAADASYNVASSVPANIVFAGGPRTLTIDSSSFTSGGYSILASPPTLTATVSIGTGAKTYTSSTIGICTVDAASGVVAFVAAGTCTIGASIAADASYASVTSSSISFSINKISQTITFGALENKTFGATPFSVSGSSTSSLSLTFTSATPSVCTVASSMVTIVAGGTCTINADQAGDSSYAIATQVAQSFTVSVASQVITFAAPGDVAYDSPSPVTLVATSTSSLTVSFTSATADVCTVSGTSVTRIAIGTCTINADQAGNGSYSAANRVVRSFTVTKATPSVSLQYPNSNTVTFSVGGTLSPSSFSSTSGGVISFSSTSTACSIDPITAVISILGAGDCNAYINVTEFGNYLARSSFTKVTITSLTGLTPVLELAVAKPGGFVVDINNYNADYGFAANVDTGTVTSVLISTTLLRITVSGVPAGTSATLSITTSKTGYAPVTSTIVGTALSNKTVTFKPNFVVASPSDVTQISTGPTRLTENPFTRSNFTFTGWNTLANGLGTTYTNQASFDFAEDVSLYAQWVQNSLFGVNPADLVFVASITAGVIDSTFTGSTSGSTVSVTYLSGGLPDGTALNIHLLRDTTRAASLITSTSSFILSLVVSWLAPDGTVPPTASGKPIRMTISNALIKKGASVYSVIGNRAEVVSTATVDGSVTISITEDPEIVIAIKKPDAPTGVAATTGANALSTVTWSAPEVNGGAEITAYVVTSSGGQTCSPSSLTILSCDVTGLTNGDDYTFTVTATNSAGISQSSAASTAVRPLAPAPTPPPTPTPTRTPAPSSGGGGGGGGAGGYVAPESTATVDSAAVAAAAKALADAKAAEERAIAEAKALAEKRAAEEAELLAVIKALQDKADADSLAAAKKLSDELAASMLKAEEELKAAAALKFAEEQRITAERAAAAKRITTLYSTTVTFKLNKTYTKRLNTYTKRIAVQSTVTCIGYVKSSKTLSYAKAKVVASKQAKALCSSMKKISPTLKTKSIVYPASKAPVTAVNKKWIPVSYRIESPVN